MSDTQDFILYTRSTCSLCDAMEDELRPLIKEYSITVKRQYIDNDVGLEGLYGSKVPVLMLDGKIICEYFLDAEALRGILEGRTDSGHTNGKASDKT